MQLKIGELGTFDFLAGTYGYVGGAFGGGGVRKRTHRHLTRHSENKKWNVDNLKPHCTPVEVWWTHDRRKVVFDWAARGLGSNDNPDAESHLIHFAELPSITRRAPITALG
jgi:Uri superfamily endonuclease